MDLPDINSLERWNNDRRFAFVDRVEHLVLYADRDKADIPLCGFFLPFRPPNDEERGGIYAYGRNLINRGAPSHNLQMLHYLSREEKDGRAWADGSCSDGRKKFPQKVIEQISKKGVTEYMWHIAELTLTAYYNAMSQVPSFSDLRINFSKVSDLHAHEPVAIVILDGPTTVIENEKGRLHSAPEFCIIFIGDGINHKSPQRAWVKSVGANIDTPSVGFFLG